MLKLKIENYPNLEIFYENVPGYFVSNNKQILWNWMVDTVCYKVKQYYQELEIKLYPDIFKIIILRNDVVFKIFTIEEVEEKEREFEVHVFLTESRTKEVVVNVQAKNVESAMQIGEQKVYDDYDCGNIEFNSDDNYSEIRVECEGHELDWHEI